MSRVGELAWRTCDERPGDGRSRGGRRGEVPAVPL